MYKQYDVDAGCNVDAECDVSTIDDVSLSDVSGECYACIVSSSIDLSTGLTSPTI